MGRQRCALCGGDSGYVNERGVHNLCAARADYGLPVHRLGDACSVCQGRTRIPRSPVCLVADPNQAAIDAWAPICEHCSGTGIEPGTAD